MAKSATAAKGEIAPGGERQADHFEAKELTTLVDSVAVKSKHILDRIVALGKEAHPDKVELDGLFATLSRYNAAFSHLLNGTDAEIKDIMFVREEVRVLGDAFWKGNYGDCVVRLAGIKPKISGGAISKHARVMEKAMELYEFFDAVLRNSLEELLYAEALELDYPGLEFTRAALLYNVAQLDITIGGLLQVLKSSRDIIEICVKSTSFPEQKRARMLLRSSAIESDTLQGI